MSQASQSNRSLVSPNLNPGIDALATSAPRPLERKAFIALIHFSYGHRAPLVAACDSDLSPTHCSESRSFKVYAQRF